MSFSKELSSYAGRFWSLRREVLGEVGEEADRVLMGCGEDEKICLQYVLATLPLSDLGDYPPELFLKFVREALALREEFAWCAALPEHLFLLHVLYPRINTEQISDCRGLFHDALAARVKGLSQEEAILEVNRWCAENATYRSTDDRTASPLAVYSCGYGRCGEESTFTVTALRSVGIPARQVYSPWWSHCEDNHAWVEAFDGKRWRYLGACEPEPELDRGWFMTASALAMRIYARTFLQGTREDWGFLFPDTDPVNLEEDCGVVYESVTERYAEMKLFTVSVKDRAGAPVSGARVEFSVLNMSRFSEIAVRKTGQDGNASLKLGKGSVRVTVRKDGLWSELLTDVSQTDRMELVLGEAQEADGWTEIDFFPPKGSAGYPPSLSEEAKKKCRADLDRINALREERLAGLRRERVGKEVPPARRRILDTLSEKDRAWEVPEEVFRDADGALAWEGTCPPEVFEASLLCPRIGLETLAPWRGILTEAFSEQEREVFREAPERCWAWIGENIRESGSYLALCGTPAGAFRLRAANLAGRRGLFCAMCRAFGVPARLSPLDGEPEYWRDGAYRRVSVAETATLTLEAPGNQAGLFAQNYGLFRREGAGEFVLLLSGDIPEGESLSLRLPAGSCRAITVNRLPGGSQLAQQRDFTLKPGEETRLSLSFRQGKPADFLECLALPPFVLRDRAGTAHDSVDLLQKNPLSLLFWLETGREPTEHILNELRESADAMASTGCPVFLILESPEQEKDPTFQKAFQAMPQARVMYGDFLDAAPALARRVYLEPERLPLVLLTDCKANSLYASAGYNVGTAALLIRLLRELSKN